MANRIKAFLDMEPRGFERGLKQATKSLDGAASTWKRRLGAFNRTAVGLLGAAGVGLGARAFDQLAEGAIKAGDEIAKAAKVADIGAETLQEYRFAAEIGGSSQKELDDAVGRFTRRLGEARRGNAEYAKTFKQLGVTAQDTNEQALEKVFKTLEGVQDVTVRTSLATKVFGDDARRMALLVRDGAGALAALRKEARDTGQVLPADLVAAAEEAQDRLTAMEGQLRTQLLETVLENVDGFVQFKQLLNDTARFAITFAVGIGEATGALKRFFGVIDEGSIDNLRRLRADIAVEIDEIEKKLRGRGALGRLGGAFQETFESIGQGRISVDFGVEAVVDPEKRLDQLKAKLAEIDQAIAAIREKEASSISTPVFDGVDLTGGFLGKTETRDVFAEQLRKIEEQTAANALLAESAGKVSTAIEALQLEQSTLNALAAAGVVLTTEQKEKLDNAVAAFERSAEARDAAAKAQERLNELQQDAAGVLEATRTPLERYEAQLVRLNELLREDFINQDTYNRAVLAAQDAFDAAARAGDTFGDRLSDALAAAIVHARSLKELLLGVVSAIENVSGRIVEEALADQLRGFLSPPPKLPAPGGLIDAGADAAASTAKASETAAATAAAGALTGLSTAAATTTGTVPAALAASASAFNAAASAEVAAMTALTAAAAAAAAALAAVAVSSVGSAALELGQQTASIFAKTGLAGLGFAGGGSFEVGGRSGVDANPVLLRLTKGERVSIDTAAQRLTERRLGDLGDLFKFAPPALAAPLLNEGLIPAGADLSGGQTINVGGINIKGETVDARSIKQSRGQIAAAMAREIRQASRNVR